MFQGQPRTVRRRRSFHGRSRRRGWAADLSRPETSRHPRNRGALPCRVGALGDPASLTVHAGVQAAPCFGMRGRAFSQRGPGPRDRRGHGPHVSRLGRSRLRSEWAATSASSRRAPLARLAWAEGVRAFVCSPHEAARLRAALGPEAKLITPGVRAAAAGSSDDQKRTMSAGDAVAHGADWVVVGRPIRDADDPAEAAQSIRALRGSDRLHCASRGGEPLNGRVICGLQPVREAIRTHGAKLARVMVVEVQSVEISPPAPKRSPDSRKTGAPRRPAAPVRARSRRPRRAPSRCHRLRAGARGHGAARARARRSLPSSTALDEIQDPQNFGAIIRSAVAMSATAVACGPSIGRRPLSPATFRASRRSDRARHPLPRVVASAGPRGAPRARALRGRARPHRSYLDRSRSISRDPWRSVKVGAEGKGLRKTIKRTCDALASLPMPGPIGFASISIRRGRSSRSAECIRQRGPRPGPDAG